MSHFFTKKGFRGFTLIELLVVIAIIGLLSTIIAAPIQNARKKARDAKKISELKAVELALDQYAEANSGNYPDTLAVLSPVYMPVLPTFASTTVAARDRFAYTRYQVSGTGITTANFGYHLGVKLETFNQGLDTDRDCTGSAVGASLPSGVCVFFNVTGATIAGNFATIVGGIPATAGGDFDGADGNKETCSANTDCIFDVSSQQ